MDLKELLSSGYLDRREYAAARWLRSTQRIAGRDPHTSSDPARGEIGAARRDYRQARNAMRRYAGPTCDVVCHGLPPAPLLDCLRAGLDRLADWWGI